MKTGRYGGLVTYEVGFKEIDNLINALEPSLANTSIKRQIPMNGFSYSDLADSYFAPVPDEADDAAPADIHCDELIKVFSAMA